MGALFYHLLLSPKKSDHQRQRRGERVRRRVLVPRQFRKEGKRRNANPDRRQPRRETRTLLGEGDSQESLTPPSPKAENPQAERGQPMIATTKPRRLRRPKPPAIHYPELTDRSGVRSVASAPQWWLSSMPAGGLEHGGAQRCYVIAMSVG